jgi:uncharacterized protein
MTSRRSRARVVTRRAVFLVLFTLLAASSAQAAAQRPVRSLLEFRQENVVIQRWDNSCGAAALATVLTYGRGVPVSEEKVARGMLRRTDALRVRHRGGFSLLDMKRYAVELGFEADGYSELTLEELAEMPWAIVPIRSRGYNHFVVVRAVDAERVDIADPGFGNYSMSIERFLVAWQGQIGFALGEKL